jgi:hypothetical protein
LSVGNQHVDGQDRRRQQRDKGYNRLCPGALQAAAFFAHLGGDRRGDMEMERQEKNCCREHERKPAGMAGAPMNELTTHDRL